MINCDGYRVIEVRDCYSENVITTICLSYKHNVKDFQEEILKAKERVIEDIRKYGDDWSYISQNISDDFDWFELDFDGDYVEV